MEPVNENEIKAFEGRSEIERYKLRHAAMWKDSRLQGYYGLWMVSCIVVFIFWNWLCETFFPSINVALPIGLTLASILPFWKAYHRRVINPLLKRVLDANGQS